MLQAANSTRSYFHFFFFWLSDWYLTGKLASQKAMVSVSLGMRRRLWVHGGICRAMKSMGDSFEWTLLRMRKEVVVVVNEIETRCFFPILLSYRFNVEKTVVDCLWSLVGRSVPLHQAWSFSGKENLKPCLYLLSKTLETLLTLKLGLWLFNIQHKQQLFFF